MRAEKAVCWQAACIRQAGAQAVGQRPGVDDEHVLRFEPGHIGEVGSRRERRQQQGGAEQQAHVQQPLKRRTAGVAAPAWTGAGGLSM